ncbi:MAG: hypothetical protein NTY19_16885 [Planctomycetota bacterium]|nr:hypothetical protein [Planctomycetota bacterium]
MEDLISGHKTFTVKELPFQSHGGVIRAAVKVDKRAQYVIARRGEAHDVFFGGP